jgi:LysM repeat protein
MFLRFKKIIFALCFALALGGCGPGMSEMRENRDPFVQRARELKQGGEIDAAIRAYNQALDRRGDMPQVHFELAAIYMQDKKDYISAIHHYQRFIDLDPSSQKTNLVAAEIRRAKMEFAASLPDRPSDAVQTIAAMEKERDLLKARINDLQSEVDKLKGRPPAPAVIAATNTSGRIVAKPSPASSNSANQVSSAATNAPAAETYVVQPGDTLAKIAREHYHDTGMAHAIYELNKNIMKSDHDLRAGQKIFLPPKRQNRGG